MYPSNKERTSGRLPEQGGDVIIAPMMNYPGPALSQWYAIHTKPHQEFAVSEMLHGRGVETYLPTLRAVNKRTRGGRGEKPFFANYLFARLDLSEIALSSLNWSPGVNRVVEFGGRPAVVPEEVIRWLRDRLQRENQQDYLQGLPLRSGDRLRIAKGPLREMEAIFERRLSAKARALVLVEMLGRLTSVQVELRDLERR